MTGGLQVSSEGDNDMETASLSNYSMIQNDSLASFVLLALINEKSWPMR